LHANYVLTKIHATSSTPLEIRYFSNLCSTFIQSLDLFSYVWILHLQWLIFFFKKKSCWSWIRVGEITFLFNKRDLIFFQLLSNFFLNPPLDLQDPHVVHTDSMIDLKKIWMELDRKNNISFNKNILRIYFSFIDLIDSNYNCYNRISISTWKKWEK
jgi:hypothetical protein